MGFRSLGLSVVDLGPGFPGFVFGIYRSESLGATWRIYGVRCVFSSCWKSAVVGSVA